MSAPAASARVVAVVVTWNRRELLAESVRAIRAQTMPVRIVVVDNASTDGTGAWLAEQDDLDVVTLRQNTGGAGGFAVGIERALCHDPELIWLLDDDTVATPTAVAELVRAWRTYPTTPRGTPPAVLASRVVWTDGRDHPMNTPRARPGATAADRAAAAAVGAMPIRSASFVSILCDAERVRERGVPVADYFLWNDDFEYSTRLIRDGVGLYVPASVVVHKTKTFGATDADPGDRFFYEVRNKAWLLGRATGLTGTEKALYGGATLRRWGRTLRGSTDRGRLVRALGRGLRAGLRRPRSNAEVLAAARPPRPADPIAGFSLLMSTWAGDDPAHLGPALRSSTVEQTRPPSEVVLVQDGPISADLAAEIDRLVAQSPIPVRQVTLAENVGLGPALMAGLAQCRYDVVARMDADDVSTPDRFARQIPLLEAGADIVGSGLVEFGAGPTDVVGRRTPPVTAAEIRRTVRFRDPFNHPTVVFRRDAVLAAGGYPDLALLEDYLLFARMVEGGAVPANIADPLIGYRVGEGAYARRGGRRLLRSEMELQRRLRRLHLTSRSEYLRNVAVRAGYRLVPESVRKVAYRRLLANRSGRMSR